MDNKSDRLDSRLMLSFWIMGGRLYPFEQKQLMSKTVMTTVYQVHCSCKSNGHSKYGDIGFSEKYEDPDSPYATIACRAMQNMGQTIRPYWPVDCVLKPREKRRKLGDLVPDASLLFLSSNAYLTLQDLIAPYGEFLPARLLKTNDVEEDWIVYHPLRCFSVIHDPRCEIEWLGPREDNCPLHVTKFYFEEEKIKDVPIFMLEEDTSMFVTDSFFNRVRDAKLKGLGFRKLWNSELGPVHSEITIKTWGLPEDEDFNW